MSQSLLDGDALDGVESQHAAQQIESCVKIHEELLLVQLPGCSTIQTTFFLKIYPVTVNCTDCKPTIMFPQFKKLFSSSIL